LEAGRKFSFEIKKHENPIIVWNYLSTISCFCRKFAVSSSFQIGLGCFLSAASKIGGSKVICPQLYNTPNAFDSHPNPPCPRLTPGSNLAEYRAVSTFRNHGYVPRLVVMKVTRIEFVVFSK